MKICASDVMEGSSCPELCKSPCPLDGGSLRVRINNSVFLLDKALLAQNCEYFRALFQSGMRECHQEEIHLRCPGVGGFAVALRVLNGERPVLSGDEIVEAIECTAFLQVRALTRHLMDAVNSDNCLLMYHTAATYGVWALSHHAALFIRDSYSDLREEVRALPGELVDYVESLVPSSYMAVCTHSPSTELLPDLQRTVRYLDEEEGEWRALTHLPLSTSTTMAGVTVLDNKLYIVGGVHDVSKKVVDSGFCYDADSDTWSTIRSPQQLRYNLALVAHDGCLYAIGGEYERKAMASVERYTVSKGTWSFAAQLPCPAASMPSAKAMSRIFICLWRPKGATEIHEYVPDRDQWLLVTTLVRPQSYGHCMVARNDNLYVMRNGPGEDFLLCVMDCYNLTSGQWTAMPGQYGNSKGSLFTAVVRGDSAFTLSRLDTTEYTVEDDRWKTRREMKGFGRIGSMYTFLMRLPKAAKPLPGRSEGLTRSQNIGSIFDRKPRSSLHCFD